MERPVRVGKVAVPVEGELVAPLCSGRTGTALGILEKDQALTLVLGVILTFTGVTVAISTAIGLVVDGVRMPVYLWSEGTALSRSGH